MVTCFPDIFCARKILYRKTGSYRSTLKLVGKHFYLPGNVDERFNDGRGTDEIYREKSVYIEAPWTGVVDQAGWGGEQTTLFHHGFLVLRSSLVQGGWKKH